MIKAIVCCAKDYGIGKKGGLLFDIPEDMKHFKETTTGNICVFGYNTYLSLYKRPLPKRVNVVLWDQAPSLDCLEGAITFSDFDQMVKFLQILGKQYDIYICGGQMLYKSMIEKGLVDEIDLTVVDYIDKEATAFFPDPLDYGYVCNTAEAPHKVDGENYAVKYFIQKQIWTKSAKEEELEMSL